MGHGLGCPTASRILAPWPGMETESPALEGEVLTTGPPGTVPSLPFSIRTKKCSLGSDCKASAYNAGNLSSILGSGRSPGEENGNPLQYSYLENPMDRGAW